jgi:hypothetical protein
MFSTPPYAGEAGRRRGNQSMLEWEVEAAAASFCFLFFASDPLLHGVTLRCGTFVWGEGIKPIFSAIPNFVFA